MTACCVWNASNAAGGNNDAIALYDYISPSQTGITSPGGVNGWPITMIYNSGHVTGREGEQWIDNDDGAGETKLGNVCVPESNIDNYYVKYTVVSGDSLDASNKTVNTYYQLNTVFLLETDSGGNAALSGRVRIHISSTNNDSGIIDTGDIDWQADGYK